MLRGNAGILRFWPHLFLEGREAVLQDLRLAFRLLRKKPLFSGAVILSLAIGIGVNTALVSLIDPLFFRSLPGLSDEARLVAIYGTRQESPEQWGRISYDDYLSYRDLGPAVVRVAAFAERPFSLRGADSSERISGSVVSLDYFEVLGVAPVLGRFFNSQEDRGAPLVVISYSLWSRHFGADRGIIGRALTLNGQPWTVIGVTRAEFIGTQRLTEPQLWVGIEACAENARSPMDSSRALLNRRREWLSLIGRLGTEVDLEAAQQAADSLASQLAAAFPDTNEDRRVVLQPLQHGIFGPGKRQVVVRYLGLLGAFSTLLFLIACMNVSGLLLARGLERQRELAVRSAHGARRRQLARLLLSESSLLAMLGGGAGVVFARILLLWGGALRLPVPVTLPPTLSDRSLIFALLLALLAGFLAGIGPAWRHSGLTPAAFLGGGAPRGGARGRRWALREVLTILQIAASSAALVAAGLMLRTLTNLRAIDPGFEPAHTLIASLDLGQAGYRSAEAVAFYEEILARLRAIPAVQSASVAGALPLIGGDLTMQMSVISPDAETEESNTVVANHAVVGAGYFRTLGIPVLEGKEFEPEDAHAPSGRVIINETMKKSLWPHGKATGRHLTLLRGGDTPFEVIGVVRDGKYGNLREPPSPTLYLFHGSPDRFWVTAMVAPAMTLLLRTEGDSLDLLPQVRQEVRALDPDLPVFGVTTLEGRLATVLHTERQSAFLLTGMGVLCLLLTVAGVYAMVARLVADRQREMGIRLALGAGRRVLLGGVLGRTLRLCGVGFLLASLALPGLRSRLEEQLFGVHAGDLETLCLAGALMVGSVLLASLLPALRCLRMDPTASLRQE